MHSGRMHGNLYSHPIDFLADVNNGRERGKSPKIYSWDRDIYEVIVGEAEAASAITALYVICNVTPELCSRAMIWFFELKTSSGNYERIGPRLKHSKVW